MGCSSAYGTGNLSIWKGTINAEMHVCVNTYIYIYIYIYISIYRLYGNICSHPDDVFFREGLTYFNKTMPHLVLHLRVTTAWPHAAGLACLQSNSILRWAHFSCSRKKSHFQLLIWFICSKVNKVVSEVCWAFSGIWVVRGACIRALEGGKNHTFRLLLLRKCVCVCATDWKLQLRCGAG